MMASEQMTVYPLIRRFAELNDRDELHDASISFYSICEVADVLQQAKFQHFKCRKTMAKLIKDLVGKYLKVRKAIYGTKGIRPKHHKLMHLWKQLLDDGFLMDCFILEHMHCLIKPLCVDLRNTKDFEGTAIRRAVQARVHQLEKNRMETIGWRTKALSTAECCSRATYFYCAAACVAKWAATAYRRHSFSRRRPFLLLPYQSLLHECSAWSRVAGITPSGSSYIFLFAMAENL